MGHHINEAGEFQSDKHPSLPPDRIRLNFNAPASQRALATLAEDYQGVDSELAQDIRHRLNSLGYKRDASQWMTVELEDSEGDPIDIDEVLVALRDIGIEVRTHAVGSHLMAKSAMRRAREAILHAADLIHPVTPRTRALEALQEFVYAAEEADGLPPGTAFLVTTAEGLLEAEDEQD